MPRTQLRSELRGRVHDGIDLPAEGRLHAGERRYDLTERDSTDDEQVHVARGSKSSARGRPVQSCDRNSVCQWDKSSSDLIGKPGGFDEDAPELLENWRCGVGLIEDLVPSHRSPKNSRGCELLELLRDGADRRAAHPDQLAYVEGLVGVGEKPTEQPAPGLVEEHCGRVARGVVACTHTAYDCTRDTYRPSPDLRIRTRGSAEKAAPGASHARPGRAIALDVING